VSVLPGGKKTLGCLDLLCSCCFFREGGSERKIYDACKPAPAQGLLCDPVQVFRYHDDEDGDAEDDGKYEGDTL
jgi:hypothetical protein